ncbi:hypothetical protein [Tsuneonella aeria]|nr:hypothetical protein [Tsuneonella aeria]
MSVTTIIIALVLVFIAWKVFAGVAKFTAIVLILGAAAWFASQGGFS